MNPEPLKTTCQDTPDQQGASQTKQRRVLGVRAAVEQQRRQAGAEERAERESDQRQRAHDEALQVAVEGQQNGESDDQPVDERHPLESSPTPAVRRIFYR